MNIKLDRFDNLFFTSDPHFFHKNILKYGRGKFFNSVEEMNEALIKNWNDVVPKDGIVFVVGDFALCSKSKLHSILDRLNGTIYLILGNHDIKKYFDHPKIVKIDNYCVLEVDGQTIIMSHFPFRSWEKRQYDSWNIHGHCHNTLDEDGSKQIDVGVDNKNRFKPFSYLEIKKDMENKTNLPVDHHTRKKTLWNKIKTVIQYLLN